MLVKALRQFTGPVNMHVDEVKEIDDEIATALIADGFVEEVYTENLTYGEWTYNAETGNDERTVSGKQSKKHLS